MENYKAVVKVEMVLAEKPMFTVVSLTIKPHSLEKRETNVFCCFLESFGVLLKSVLFGLSVCLVHCHYQKTTSFSTCVTPDSYRSSRAPRVISLIRDGSVKGGNLRKGGEFPSC